jgi:hypothetical protein
MAREITEVWVVRGAVGNVIAHVETEAEAATWRFGGNTIERLPLLTPHDAAVLEAAERLASATLKVSAAHMLGQPSQGEAQALMREIQESVSAVEEAVTARRAANAGGEP